MPKVYSGQLDVDVANEDRKAKRFLFRPLETFICGGDPDVIFQQLKQYDNPPSLCGRVFRLGEPTYFCRCVPCFAVEYHNSGICWQFCCLVYIVGIAIVM